MIDKDKILFPYSEIRNIQGDMIKEVMDSIEKGEHALIHAPTGLGKTIGVLGPALSVALKKGLSIFFLTSRHTQHHLAVNTLKDIKEKHGVKVISCDIIGKQWMCALGEVEGLYANEFREYCKKLRDDDACEFYVNTKKKSGRPTLKAMSVMEDLKVLSPMHCEKLGEFCKSEKLCPYEMSSFLAKEATVIIADYYYIFNPDIRNTFFNKSGKELEKSIIIVDEAHNLPRRCRELMSSNLSNFTLKRAIKEAAKFGYDDAREKLYDVMDSLEVMSNDLDFRKDEKLIKKKIFVDKVKDYDNSISEFSFAADDIREKQKKSYVGSVGSFLGAWTGEDKGFVRVLSKKLGSREPFINLMYKCLDPSLVAKEVISGAYSLICMSGTLTPTFMYKDILGFNDVKEKVFGSPFPKTNRLSLIVPETTTKYTRRSEDEFKKMAKVCADIVNLVPGNSLVFFPSYALRDSVYAHFLELCKKEIFIEKPRLSKEDKHSLLEDFKKCKDKGACLMGVTAGSFGEGVDLPGDFVKCVIVVGLPLERPSLEVKELIDYYDLKYGKGWDYGYIFPAMIKTLQNAGRCIRSEKDKGVVIFLDERYVEPKYYNCFPPDYGVKISKMYKERIKEFFEKKGIE
jgi:DNA excision repair protein ERCC-2